MQTIPPINSTRPVQETPRFAPSADIKDATITNKDGAELFRVRYKPISRYMVIEATTTANAVHKRECACVNAKGEPADRKKCKETNPAVLEKELARRCITWWSLEQNVRHHFDVVWESLDMDVGTAFSQALGIEAFFSEQAQKAEVDKGKNS